MNGDDWTSVLADGGAPSTAVGADAGGGYDDEPYEHPNDWPPYHPAPITEPIVPAVPTASTAPAGSATPAVPDRLAGLRARMATYDSGRRSAAIAGVVLALLGAAIGDAVAIELTAGNSRSSHTGATADLIAALTAAPTVPPAATGAAGSGSPAPTTSAGPTGRPRRAPSAPARRSVVAVRPAPGAGGRGGPAAAPPAPHLAAAMSSSPNSARYTFTVRNTGTAPLRITAITLTRGRDVSSVNVVSDGAAGCRGATIAPGSSCGWQSIILPPVVNPFRGRADLLSGAWCYETIRSTAPGGAAELGFDVGVF